MVQLPREIAAQIQIDIDHLADHAKHQVGGTDRNASGTKGSIVDSSLLCAMQRRLAHWRVGLRSFAGRHQSRSISFTNDAVVGVKREQDIVENCKPNGAGVNPPKGRRAAEL